MGAHEIAEDIKNEIIAGRIKFGDKLPTVRAQKERLGVSQQTVASAYGMLADQGMVKTDRNSGTTVIAAPPGSAHLGAYKPAELSVLDPWKVDGDGVGGEFALSIRQFEAGEREVAWGFPEGIAMVERIRLRTINDVPAHYRLTVIPYSVAALVPEGFQGVPPMLAPVGAPAPDKPEGVRMADWLGWDIAHSEITIKTQGMTEQVSEKLNKPNKTPGTVTTTIVKDSQGDVLYVTEFTVPMHHPITMTVIG